MFIEKSQDEIYQIVALAQLSNFSEGMKTFVLRALQAHILTDIIFTRLKRVCIGFLAGIINWKHHRYGLLATNRGINNRKCNAKKYARCLCFWITTSLV